MRKALSVVIFPFAFVATIAFAADDKPPPAMPLITEWEGPFKETRVAKFADVSEGVACYVLMPMTVSTAYNCSNGKCATQFKDSIGSISCVKVSGDKVVPSLLQKPTK